MMRFVWLSVFVLLPFAANAEERVMGLTETERQEMRLCTSLKDYEQAVQEVAGLSAESTRADVEFAYDAVETEWRDVENDAEEYEQVQTTQLARQANALHTALAEVGMDAEPQVIESHAAPIAEDTLEALRPVQSQVECSKPVAEF